jgi:hypothetical protein
MQEVADAVILRIVGVTLKSGYHLLVCSLW